MLSVTHNKHFNNLSLLSISFPLVVWICFEQSESKYCIYFEKTKGKFVISYTSPNVILGLYRAVLKQLSKVPGNGFGFAFLLSVIGPDISHHPLSQSDTRLKPVTTQSIWFSRHFSVYICSPWPLWLLVLVLLAGVDGIYFNM